MIDLAPCPFCGEKLVQHDDHHGTWWAHKNEVGSCWASVEQIHDNDDAKRWNKRHAQRALSPDAIAHILQSNMRDKSGCFVGWETCFSAAEAILSTLTSIECGGGK